MNTMKKQRSARMERLTQELFEPLTAVQLWRASGLAAVSKPTLIIIYKAGGTVENQSDPEYIPV